MNDEKSTSSLPKQYRRHALEAVDQFAIGAIIFMWGSLLMLKQVGILDKNLSTWPFVFIAFGSLLVAGSIYRLKNRNGTPFQAEPN
jgi:hypothetical protein